MIHLRSSRKTSVAKCISAELKSERQGKTKSFRSLCASEKSLHVNLSAVRSHWRVVSGTWHDLIYQNKTKVDREWILEEADQNWKHGGQLRSFCCSCYNLSWSRLDMPVAWTRLMVVGNGKKEYIFWR